MAGIQLSDTRESALLAQLLERGRGRRGEDNINAVQALANLGAEFLDNRKIEKILKKEEEGGKRDQANDAALSGAILGQAAVDFSGKAIKNTPDIQGAPGGADPRGAASQQIIPGDTNSAVSAMAGIVGQPTAATQGQQGQLAPPSDVNQQLAHTLKQNPDSKFGQSVQAQLINNQLKAPDKPATPTFTTDDGIAKRDIMGLDGEVAIKKGEEFIVTARRSGADGTVDYYIDDFDTEIPVSTKDYRAATKRTSEESAQLTDFEKLPPGEQGRLRSEFGQLYQ